jgi:hypothetical protein
VQDYFTDVPALKKMARETRIGFDLKQLRRHIDAFIDSTMTPPSHLEPKPRSKEPPQCTFRSSMIQVLA